MSTLQITLLSFLLLIILVAMGVHLGVSLLSCSIVGMILAVGNYDVAVNMVISTAYNSLKDYIFGVTPLFILMGLLANLSGASGSLYDSCHLLFRRLKGSLGYATVVANAIFAAVTGVSIASAAVFTKIAVPQMRKHGYEKKFSVGSVAGSSILGMLIPPSVLMILYGTASGTSIGHLFVAGVIPGIITTVIFMFTIWLTIKIKPDTVPNMGEAVNTMGRKERMSIILKPWPMILLILVSLGGIWMGYFTPTEAGGVAAFGALLLVIANKKFTPRGFLEVLRNAGVSTGSVMFLLITAQMYSRALAVSGAINLVEDFILSLRMPPILVVIMFMIIFLVLGCVLDSTSIVLLCMPIMCPIIANYGYDLVWFGIISIIAIQIGIISPPFGMSVFTVKSALGDIGSTDGDDISVIDIFKGSMPYIAGMVAVLIICIVFPKVVLIAL